MGKKKRGANKRTTSRGENEQEERPATATAEHVRSLPLALHHVWKCVIFEAEAGSALGIMDMTNTMMGRGDISRSMKFCDVPKIVLDNGSLREEGLEELVQAIFDAMAHPAGENRGEEFHRPRRPVFLLMDPAFRPAYEYVKHRVEGVGVSVRMYSERSYAEAFAAAFENAAQMDSTRCTWYEGTRSLGAPNVPMLTRLPLCREETWKCAMYHDEDPNAIFLIVENISNSLILPVGMGPCLPSCLPRSIMLVMLAPKKVSGQDLVDDLPRRRGRLVLHATFKVDLMRLREIFHGSGVIFLMESDLCGFCHKERDANHTLLTCSKCKSAAYCDRNCQSKHWKTHKKTCKSST